MKHHAPVSSLFLLGRGILKLVGLNDDGMVSAFSSLSWSKTVMRRAASNYPRPMTAGPSEGIDLDDDDEEAEPGQMRVSEIKAELDMRGVAYSDCFDKESMAERLREARAKGKADPSILNEFNKNRMEANFRGEKLEIDDEVVSQATANDGTLPGGMTPEVMKTLLDNPELMALLQSTKMQDIMKIMMTEGQEALEQKMVEDEEVREMVTKLNELMAGTGIN